MMSRVLVEKRPTGSMPVYVNVYDLTTINVYAYWLGLGVYHSGVQVDGVEYAFGAHEYSWTGVYEVKPKSSPSFIFRKSILVGWTDKDSKEVHHFMKEISQDYPGNTYNLITKNCNHFCNDVCIKLTGRAIPGWINRLARMGVICKCVLPPSVNETKISKLRYEEVQEGEMNKPKTPLTLLQQLSLPEHHHSFSWRVILGKNPSISSNSKEIRRDCCLPTHSVRITHMYKHQHQHHCAHT